MIIKKKTGNQIGIHQKIENYFSFNRGGSIGSDRI